MLQLVAARWFEFVAYNASFVAPHGTEATSVFRFACSNWSQTIYHLVWFLSNVTAPHRCGATNAAPFWGWTQPNISVTFLRPAFEQTIERKLRPLFMVLNRRPLLNHAVAQWMECEKFCSLLHNDFVACKFTTLSIQWGYCGRICPLNKLAKVWGSRKLDTTHAKATVPGRMQIHWQKSDATYPMTSFRWFLGPV